MPTDCRLRLLSATAITLSLGAFADAGTALAQCVPGNTGTAGNDAITCSDPVAAGNVNGLAGNDSITLNSGTVSGSIVGGEGADSITMAAGSVTGLVRGGTENDAITLAGATVVGNLEGSAGNDTISVTSGLTRGSVHGEDGDDVILLSGGTVGDGVQADGTRAGNGNDLIVTSGNFVTRGGLQGNAGSDTIVMNGGTLANNINGDFPDVVGAADLIEINAGRIPGQVFAEGGDDTVTMTGGTVGGSIFGGRNNAGIASGNDLITLTGGTVQANVLGEDGNDTITLGGATVGGRVLAGVGADSIVMTGGSVNGNGTDAIDGGAGDDSVTLTGGTVSDRVLSGAGDDAITLNGVQVLSDVIAGDDNDTITLGSGSVGGDLEGGDGDDLLILLSGTLGGSAYLGEGNDTLLLDGMTIGTIYADGGNDNVVIESGSVAGDIFGYDGNDLIEVAGSDGAVAGNIYGGSGNDTLRFTEEFGTTGDLVGEDGDGDVLVFDGLTATLDPHAAIDGWEELQVVNGAVLDLFTDGVTKRALGDGADGSFVVWVDGDSAMVGEGSSPAATTINGDFALQGLFDMADGDGEDDLIVNGAFTGGGTGVIAINAQLDAAGDAGDIADFITIDGAVAQIQVPNGPLVAAGPTGIIVEDIGDGTGSDTGDGVGAGIPVISVVGAHQETDFYLVGGPIIRGFWAYDLDEEPDELYYLQSTRFAQAAPDAALPASLLFFGQDAMATLYERVGVRRAAEGGDTGAWVRSFGSLKDHSGELETGDTSFDVEFEQDSWGVQAGLDVEVMSGAGGRLVLGAHGLYGQSSLDAEDETGDDAGGVDWDAWGGGATATWYGAQGFYTDLVGQAIVYDGSLEAGGDTLASPEGFGWGASAELGYAFQAAANIAVVPQFQLSYQQADFDDFVAEGVAITFEHGESLQARAGVVGEYGFGAGSKAYAEANIVYEFLGETEVRANGTAFRHDLGGMSAELGAGVSAQIGSGVSLYGEVDYRFPFDDGTTSLDGTAGIRVSF